MEPPPLSERRRVLRDRLIHHAEELLRAEGLASLQARRLAELAGCSVGAIYGVFPDLDELILTANARTLEGIGSHVRTALVQHPEATVGESFIVLALAYLSFAQSNEPAWRALFEFRPAEGKSYPDWYVEAQVRAFSILEQVILTLGPDALGAMRPDDAKRLGRTLWAAVHGIVLSGMDGRLGAHSGEEIHARILLLLSLVSRGLGLAEPHP